MESTTTFTVRKELDVPHSTFLRIFLKPARYLRLRREIVAQGAHRYHFRIDGPAPAVKEYLAFVCIGAPALGPVSGVYLWIGDDLYTGAEALSQRPPDLLPPNDPTEDHVVPVAYIPQVSFNAYLHMHLWGDPRRPTPKTIHWPHFPFSKPPPTRPRPPVSRPLPDSRPLCPLPTALSLLPELSDVSLDTHESAATRYNSGNGLKCKDYTLATFPFLKAPAHSPSTPGSPASA